MLSPRLVSILSSPFGVFQPAVRKDPQSPGSLLLTSADTPRPRGNMPISGKVTTAGHPLDLPSGVAKRSTGSDVRRPPEHQLTCCMIFLRSSSRGLNPDAGVNIGSTTFGGLKKRIETFYRRE